MIERSLVPYRELCIKYTPEQYKSSVRLLGMVNSILKQCDDLEVALFEIFQALNLNDAEGVSLDYLGAVIGVSRNIGEGDEDYLGRILIWRDLNGIPTPEALRRVIQLVSGVSEIGLYPVWPAEMYYVLYDSTEADLSELESEYMTSGVSLVQGTFLCCEPGEAYGLIVLEDNGKPLVIDQRWPDTTYAMVDSDGYIIADDEGAAVVGIDYLTSQESVEID